MTHIYALVDPRNGDLRYVGRCMYPDYRRAAHVKGEGSEDKRAWTEELHAAGTAPLMVVLERIGSSVFQSADRVSDEYDEARSAERRWIRHFADQGAPLFNRQHMPKEAVAA